ncbi:MAG: hypothetical protein NTY02_04220 [Acidobacteria bacterium]|nr:hypothetical protein [Acidobacteriota bacterium]
MLAALLATLIGSQPAVLGARQGEAVPPQTSTQPASNVDAMGVDLNRIKRELAWKPARAGASPLKLEYFVEVIAEAPPILLFQPGELSTGPAPMGAPTHRDMIDHVTPLAFKSPSVPISTIAIIGIQKLIEREARMARERRLEEVRQKKIDEERERQRRINESIVVTPPKSGPGF